MLTAHTSPLPPHTWGLGSVNQHSSHADGQTGQRSQFTCPVYIATYHPIKPVYSESLSVTVSVVIGTCTVLVGTVDSVPVPPQFHQYFCCLYGFKFTILKMPKNHHVENIFPLLEIWTNMGVKTHNFRILSRPKKPWRKIASNRFFFLKMIFCGSWMAGNFTAEHYLFLDSLIFFFGFKTTNTVHSTFLIHILTF